MHYYTQKNPICQDFIKHFFIFLENIIFHVVLWHFSSPFGRIRALFFASHQGSHAKKEPCRMSRALKDNFLNRIKHVTYR